MVTAPIENCPSTNYFLSRWVDVVIKVKHGQSWNGQSVGIRGSLVLNVDITYRHHFSTNVNCSDMARLSGLQRDVLSLYRQCLRAVREKPSV